VTAGPSPHPDAASIEDLTAARPRGPALERAFDLYRRTATSRTAMALVAANAVPLVGVLFLGWSLWTILAIYWVENGIVGLWNIPKILLAQGVLLPGRVGVGYRAWAVQPMPAAARGFIAVFFAIHYGIFWLVHGMFVLVLPTFLGFTGSFNGLLGLDLGTDPSITNGLPMPSPFPPASPIPSVGPFGVLDWSAVLTAAVVLAVSHGLSFFVDYLGSGEYRTKLAAVQMFAPYGRVAVLHLTILFGAFAIAFLGAPIVLLVILVVGKTLLDLGLHLRHSPFLLPTAAATA
jgi:Family of unknown function (DUF6498)